MVRDVISWESMPGAGYYALGIRRSALESWMLFSGLTESRSLIVFRR